MLHDIDRSFPFALAALLTLTATALAQSTARISVAGSGAELTYGGTWSGISGDGRYASFVAYDPVLPGDTNGTTDVYVRELTTGVVRRVSVTAAGVQPDGPCFDPVLSDDGRYIAFSTHATNLAASDINGVFTDIFVKDMLTGALQHVSVNAAGVGGNQTSAYHDMSGDGRIVTFYSYATNLVPYDLDNQQDTYVVDRTTGQIQCLSIDPLTGQAAGGGEASVSGDGRFVAFETWAPLFGPAGSTIALFDRQAGTYACVSMLAGQAVFASSPDVSGDGSKVLFQSAFSFDPADTDFFADVYTFDVATGAHRLVSAAPAPTGFFAACLVGACSVDARYIAFSTSDSYLAIDTNDFADTYVRDMVTGALELVTRGNGGEIADGAGYVTAMSSDGRRCAFSSSAANLVPGDTNTVPDVFVRDRAVAASWLAYGAGFPGTGGVVPGIALLGEPTIGTSPLLGVANNTGAPAATLLVLGLQSASLPTPVLGTLLVQPAATSLLIAPSPALLLPLPIPNVFELTGLHLHLQALVIDNGAPAGVAFTRGIDATIGG